MSALNFLKAKKAPTSDQVEPEAATEKVAKSAPAPAPKPAPQTQTPASKPVGMSFLKTGKDARVAQQRQEALDEQRKAESNKMFRFWMKEDGEDRKITFLDGELDADGMLNVPMYYEHTVKLNGDFKQFVCTNEQEGFCPICEKGESKSSLVAIFTIIDHSTHVVQKGPNAGKEVKNTRKLFVAKKETLKLLSKKATKYEGLTGVTFDVSRVGTKSASVGTQFEFDVKASKAQLMAKYGLKAEDVEPANYDKELTYRSAAELVELGVGKAHGGVGYESGSGKSLKDAI